MLLRGCLRETEAVRVGAGGEGEGVLSVADDIVYVYVSVYGSPVSECDIAMILRDSGVTGRSCLMLRMFRDRLSLFNQPPNSDYSKIYFEYKSIAVEAVCKCVDEPNCRVFMRFS